MRNLGIMNFERRHQQLISPQRFADRMLKSIGLWLALAIFGLVIGMAGYAEFEDMSLVDAYVNAAMISSGMGPVGELKTTAGQIFAGSYAIFSGLVIVIATGLVLALVHCRSVRTNGWRSILHIAKRVLAFLFLTRVSAMRLPGHAASP